MTRALLRFAFTLLFTGFFCALHAEPVPRNPPPLFAQALEPLLTPLVKVLPGRTAFPKSDSHGVVLLSEVIHYRDADGTDYRLLHDVFLASDDSAAEFMGNRIYSYNREHESIFLITATTISPTGTRQELDDRAAFLQTPQHEAENGLYTSDQELNLIFPKVVPGAITEMIVLIKVDKPVFPGEFAEHKVFANGWPAYRSRLVLDFPENSVERVHTVASSPLVPEPLVEQPTAGRTRKTWTRDQIDKVEWEESAPSLEFIAPTLWLTTLTSWDQVTGWFGDLVQDRSDLGADLEKELKQWTAGLTDSKSIVAKLCTVVANDVRYTGLEFGLAGYQPYPCAQVWANRYGDCKDKANLLRALLARKGIRSHLVLLQTGALGRVEKRSPSWKQFNHAILAVDNGKDGYLFCDPTIKYIGAGMLGKGDMARSVLLVKDGHAEWAQTPDLLNNRAHYGADLVLGPTGELSGWFTLRAEGADAAAYTDYFNKLDGPQRQRNLQQLIDGFFPGAEIMDVAYTPLSGAVADFSIRCYFLRKSGSASAEAVQFPYPTGWLPNVGTNADRKYPYATSRRVESMDVTIRLPEGWNATHPVEPFNATSEVARIEASWSHQPGQLSAHLQWQPESAELGSKDYAVFQRSIRALRSWLEHPAQIAQGPALTEVTAKTALANFPVLATGEGQLRLLEQRFPAGQNDPARRAALDQVLQWFPDDSATIFQAKLYLLLLEPKSADAARAGAMTKLISRYESRVSAELRAWGRFLAARALWESRHDPAAIADLKKMTDDAALSSYRRNWCAYTAALFLSEKDPSAALTLLSRHDTIAGESLDSILQLEVRLLTRQVSPSAARKWGERIAKELPEDADQLLETALRSLNDERGAFPQESLEKLAEGLGPVAVSAKFPKAAAQLARIETVANSVRLRTAYVKTLGAWIDAHPQAWLTLGKSTKYSDGAAAIADIEAMNTASNGKGVIDATMQLIRYQQTDYRTFAKYLFWCGWWLHRDQSDPDLFAAIAAGSFSLPVQDGGEIVNLWNKYGSDLATQKRDDDAREVFQRVINHSGAEPYQRVEAAGELASVELRADHIDAALAALTICAKDHLTNQRGAEYLFIDALLQLELGHEDQALTLVADIGRHEKSQLQAVRYAEPIGYLLANAAQPDALRAYWHRRQEWRPAWDELLRRYGVKPAQPNQPPLIENLIALQTQLKESANSHDTIAFLRGLDRLVRTTQWIPIYLGNVCNLTNQSGLISNALRQDLIQFELQLVRNFPNVDDSAYRTARIWEAALLTDSGHPAEAGKLARKAFEEFGAGTPTGAAGLRLWLANCANTPDEADAIAAATQVLADGKEVSDRLLTLSFFSDALSRRLENAANLTVLDRELKRPEALASSPITKRLEERLQQLRDEAVTTGDFTQSVRAWLHQQKLDWLLSVPPTDLNGSRYAHPQPNGLYIDSGLSYMEVFKTHLLVALDETKRIDTRYVAFYEFTTVACAMAPLARDYTERVLEATRIPSLPDRIRRPILGEAINNLLRDGQAGLAEKLVAADPASPTTIRLQPLFDTSFTLSLALFEFNSEKAAAAFRSATKQPLRQTEIALCQIILARLVYSGETKLASSLLENATDLNVAAGVRTSAGALRIEWSRLIRRETANLPFYEEVRKILVRHCQPGDADSQLQEQLTRYWGFSSLDHAARCRMVAAVFSNNSFGVEDPLAVISKLHFGHSFIAHRRDLGPDLTAAVLKANLDDNTREAWLVQVSPLSDPDTPSVRSRIELLSREFLATSKVETDPLARKAVILRLAGIALRTSNDPQPQELFGPVAEAEIPKDKLARFQFMFLVSRIQKRKASALLEQVPADELSDSSLFPYAIKAVDDPGERKLLTAAAREKIVSSLTELWLEGRPWEFYKAARVAELIGEPDLLPDSLFEHAIAAKSDEWDRQIIHLSQAMLHHDWTAQRDAANGALARSEEDYETVYRRGEALFHLGELAAAKKDLELYLSKALDSSLRPEAEAMIAKIPGS